MAESRVDTVASRLAVDVNVIIDLLAETGEPPHTPSTKIDTATIRFLYEKVAAGINSKSQVVDSPTGPASASANRSHIPEAQSNNPARIPLSGMGNTRDIDVVMKACRASTKRPNAKLIFDLSEAKGFYPNAAVPIAAIISFYRSLGIDITLENVPSPALAMRIDDPIQTSPESLEVEPTLSRIWSYDNHIQANALTTAIISAIRYRIECTSGVLEALEWCLYEVLDNVTQHSGGARGYVMVQHHATSKRLAVCIADTGVGVQRSLASSVGHKPRTAFDALTLAIQEGVTRDSQTNQGNGLFGLFRIVEQNLGKLNIRSGRGSMRIDGSRIAGDSDQLIIGSDNHGTIIDFQLSASRPVSMGEALNYTHVNDFLENLENDTGEHTLLIRDQAGGAGSRVAARELRTLIVNILNQGAPYVILDFSGQSVVSSSFADEVIGKLVVEMGFVTFNHRLRLVSMSPTVATLLDRAITLRVSTPAKHAISIIT